MRAGDVLFELGGERELQLADRALEYGHVTSRPNPIGREVGRAPRRPKNRWNIGPDLLV